MTRAEKKGNEGEITLLPQNDQFLLRSEMAIWFWITGDKGRKVMKALRMRIYFKKMTRLPI